MIRALKIILIIVGLFSIIFLSTGILYYSVCIAEKYMSLNEAKRRWGDDLFDTNKFKNGDENLRASMVVDLIKNKSYLGKPISQVRKDLGNYDGYYNSDEIPVYFISPTPKGPDDDVWQIIFFSNDDNSVRNVKIHRNCCRHFACDIFERVVSVSISVGSLLVPIW